MGMHHGILAASASQAELLAELTRHTGEFVVGAPVGCPYDAEPAAMDRGWRMAIGERDGQAFLLDSSMLLTNSPDMLVAMSARLGMVAGCGAETVSGSYWLTAARDGVLLRFVFVQHAGMTRGMAQGDPLPSEAEHPIEDFDGGGLLAAMATLGLHARPWLVADGAVAGCCQPEQRRLGLLGDQVDGLHAGWMTAGSPRRGRGGGDGHAGGRQDHVLGPHLEPRDERHPPAVSFVCRSLISAPSMPVGRVGGGNRRRISRTVGEAWRSCHRASRATAVGSFGAASPRLEQRQRPLGAVGGPHGQHPPVVLAQRQCAWLAAHTQDSPIG